MKLKLLIIGLALVLSALPSYAGGIVMMGGGVAPAASASTYVGWANSDGTPTGTPPNQTGSATTYTVARTWTATEGGTAKSVQFYAGATRWKPASAWVVLYRNISGTITLVGSGTVTGVSAGSWSGKFTLTAESGQSLDFSTDDVLYFGVAWYDASNSQYVGRDEQTSSHAQYYNASSVQTGPLSTVTWSVSSPNREMALILEYE